MKKIFWKKIFCRTTCILVVLAFVFPLLIQPAFASTEGGKNGGTVIINPSYDTTNGRLSVKGKIIDGGSIRVTIKVISPSDSYYTLMRKQAMLMENTFLQDRLLMKRVNTKYM